MTNRLKKQALSESVLSHARRDFTTLQPEQTVESALASLRTRELAEKIVYFYVVDDQGRLCGVVPTRRLLMSPLEATIGSIMVQSIVTIPAAATVLDACEFFAMYRFLAFPVVDEQRRLLGVVDVNLFTEEIFDVAEAKSIDGLFQLIGVHIAQARTGSPWAGFRSRFPWLLANITGGILCALVAGLYEAFIDQVIVLALFIPIVLALAESVSIQAMTITVQGFVGSKVNWGLFARSLGKEFLTATLLGVASGGTVAAITWLWKGHALVALAIWASITLSMVTACLLGAVLPTAVHAAGGDPKIAAGPLVLAITDVATLLFYFNLAGILLR